MIWRAMMNRVAPKTEQQTIHSRSPSTIRRTLQRQSANSISIGQNQIENEIDVDRLRSFSPPRKVSIVNHSNQEQNKSFVHNHVVGQSSENNRKVQFGPATISYQVSYDKHYANQADLARHRKEMFCPRTRCKMFIWLLKQITFADWIRWLVCIIIGLQCFWQCLAFWNQYKKKSILNTSINYELPQRIELPAITVCLPIAIRLSRICSEAFSKDSDISSILIDSKPNDHIDGGINSSCSQTFLSELFNQTFSQLDHQCKIIYFNRSIGTQNNDHQQSLNVLPSIINCANISPTIENIYQSQRCYTYFSRIASNQSNLIEVFDTPISRYENLEIQISVQTKNFVQTFRFGNPSIYLHQNDQIPIDLVREPLRVKLGYRYRLRYHLVKTIKMDQKYFECRDYDDDDDDRLESLTTHKKWLHKHNSREGCYLQCFLQRWRNRCGSCFPIKFIPIRRDLIKPYDRFCSNFSSKKIHNDQDENEDDQKCQSGEMLENIADVCNQHCPNDCTEIDVESDLEKMINDDLEQSLITIKRKIRPDLIISKNPSFNGLQLLSHIGGLLMFWILIGWFLIKIIEFISFCWDFIQLKFL
ncbi:hypothetical protein NH340_JMT01294 [Sarcoptes scabiei]|nr:hypothetical protein NH340_JMT01294 [Sarcoptes scabiei]